MKIKKFLADNKFAFIFFAALLGCGLATVNWKDFNDGLSRATYAFYLADFSLGFCSKHFVGALVGLFKHTFTDVWLKGLVYTVVVLTCAVTAFMFAKVFKGLDGKNQKHLIFAAAAFAALPYCFSIFFKYLGFFDNYWYLLTLVAIACVNNKFAKWLIPVVCFLGLGVHYIYVATFFPLIFILIVYNIANGENKRSDISLLAVTLAVTFVATAYFLFFANYTATMPADDAFEYMGSRFNLPLDRTYYDFNLYGVYEGEQISTLSHAIYMYVTVNLRDNLNYNNLGKTAIYIIVLFSAFNYIWVSAIRHGKTKADKLVFTLCLLLSFLLLPLLLLSTDYDRWTSLMAIIEFMAVGYFLYRKDATVTPIFEKTCSALLSQPLVLAAAALIILI